MSYSYRSALLRKGRFSQPGQIYSITTVTRNRAPLFRHWPVARILVQQLILSAREGETTTLAYVIMPDHLHWLIQLGDTKDLSAVVQKMKSSTTRKIHAAGMAEEKIWQRHFHDHAVRKDAHLLKLARYIVANPLRANLVTRIEDYPHWDCIWL